MTGIFSVHGPGETVDVQFRQNMEIWSSLGNEKGKGTRTGINEKSLLFNLSETLKEVLHNEGLG